VVNHSQSESTDWKSSGLRFYFASALLLVSIPLPIMVALMYAGGGWRDAGATFFSWMMLPFFYWLPVGLVLFRWRGGGVARFVVGFLASLPLYFLSLYLVYPAFGGHFHPGSRAIWGIYFSQTPTYFLLAYFLYLLTQRGARLARVITIVAAVFFAAGLAAPAIVRGRTDQYAWPKGEQAGGGVNITGAHIVDTSAGKIVDGKDVHVKDGRILEIVDAAADASSLPKLDAGGQYLLPGLMDVHTHLQVPFRSLAAGFEFGYFVDSMFSRFAPNRRAYLEAGVTTVRDLGGPAAGCFQLRAELANHQLLGPRLLCAGRLVTAPRGHPVSTIWTPSITRQGAILAYDSPSLISGLEKNYAAGPPDAVKFIYGTIGRAPERLRTDLLEQGIAWAKSKGLISVVHVETAGEVTEAVRAGATGVEHVATMEVLPDDLIPLMLEKKTFVDPTFGEFDAALALAKVNAPERARRIQEKYGFIRRIAAAGVPLTIGTDAPLVAYGAGFHDEMAQFLKAGFQPAEILRFATINNTAYLGKGGESGRIAPGYRADMVLARENPLENLGTLRKPVWVMLDGQIVAPEK
jgi:imidazolonepropionase-like amidohydrolase